MVALQLRELIKRAQVGDQEEQLFEALFLLASKLATEYESYNHPIEEIRRACFYALLDALRQFNAGGDEELVDFSRPFIEKRLAQLGTTPSAKDLEHYVETQDFLKSDRKSSFFESETIGRISEWFGKFERLMEQAIDVFGSEEKALKWFETSLPSLGGKTPLECVVAEAGALEIKDILGRIAHGIFS